MPVTTRYIIPRILRQTGELQYSRACTLAVDLTGSATMACTVKGLTTPKRFFPRLGGFGGKQFTIWNHYFLSFFLSFPLCALIDSSEMRDIELN